MFHGDDPRLAAVVRRACSTARDLGRGRVGSEDLLLALARGGDRVAEILAGHGASAAAVRSAADTAAPQGAGAAADRALLATLGVDLDRLLPDPAGAPWDRLVGRAPLLPLGSSAARRRSARRNPPLGLDAQAAYEASLRLALARRERQHRPEHLALALVTLDPGVDWLLATLGTDRRVLAEELAAAFPAPARAHIQRAERRLGSRSRHRRLVRRYQHVTGRTAIDGAALAKLING
ncbi:MAG TPA: Clp protease N-terminal domain-containing protein [Actinocrinis sp.]|nr:Clp protease N-terminal domain-containing protein [Actinocrinis sp.]